MKNLPVDSLTSLIRWQWSLSNWSNAPLHNFNNTKNIMFRFLWLSVVPLSMFKSHGEGYLRKKYRNCFYKSVHITTCADVCVSHERFLWTHRRRVCYISGARQGCSDVTIPESLIGDTVIIIQRTINVSKTWYSIYFCSYMNRKQTERQCKALSPKFKVVQGKKKEKS